MALGNLKEGQVGLFDAKNLVLQSSNFIIKFEFSNGSSPLKTCHLEMDANFSTHAVVLIVVKLFQLFESSRMLNDAKKKSSLV